MLVTETDTTYRKKTYEVNYNDTFPVGHPDEGDPMWMVAATTKTNEIQDTYFITGNYNLTIPSDSSILRVTVNLEDSFNLQNGGERRTKITILNDSTELLSVNTSHDRSVRYRKDLFLNPEYIESETSLSIKFDSFVEPIWSVQDYSMPIAVRSPGSCGASADSALVTGGQITTFNDQDATYESNGSTWTSTGVFPYTVWRVSCCGIQSDALAVGGYSYATYTVKDLSYEYNGSTWGSSATLNVARQAATTAGITSAALVIGGDNYGETGFSDSGYSIAETYNGTTWDVESNAYPNRIYLAGCFADKASGGSTDALIIGGSLSGRINTNLNYSWDGTTFRYHSTLLAVRGNGGYAGVNDGSSWSGVAYGGFTGFQNGTGSLMNSSEVLEDDIWRAAAPMLIKRADTSSIGVVTDACAIGGTSYFVMGEVFSASGTSASNLTNLTSGKLQVVVDYISY